jgi:hypothetical protein
MADEQPTNYCCCEEGGGIPHSHRNPPYSTEGRTALMKKKQEKHQPVKHNMLPFDEDELATITAEASAEAEEVMYDMVKRRKNESSLAAWLKEVEAKKK